MAVAVPNARRRTRRGVLLMAGAAAVAAALLLAPAAQAATPDVIYVDDSDFAVGPIIDGWNSLAGPVPVSGLTGLTIAANSRITLDFPVDPTDLPASVAELSDIPVLAGQIVTPTFVVLAEASDPSSEQLFIATSALPGSADLTSAWFLPGVFGLLPSGTYSLTELQAEAMTMPNFVIDAVQFATDGSGAVLTDALLGGEQYIFTPEPVFTAPTTIAVNTLTSTGITITTTGFLPGESIEVYASSPENGGKVADVIADEFGAATYTFVAEAGSPTGAWRLVFVGSVPNAQLFDVEVTAAQLAVTGAEAGVVLTLGGALLALGTAAIIVSARREHLAD